MWEPSRKGYQISRVDRCCCVPLVVGDARKNDNFIYPLESARDLVKLVENLTQFGLSGTNIEVGNKQAVLEKLQKYLGAGRFLLVLDDVWNDSKGKWDDFINPLKKISYGTGNGIVVTTRNQSIASLVTTLPIHKLKELSEEECLPLTARMVGGLLLGKSLDEWLHIEENWLLDLRDENSISKILKLSFDHLSSPALKKCFAYCSIYPKGYDLLRERLVELWMAEGFLGGNDDMEIVGNKFFHNLLENSLLLQVVERNGDDNIIYYNMHDLVHDLASSILNSSDQVRYIGWESIDGQSHAILKEQVSCLCSLSFNDSICDLMFSKFKSLHVLILNSGGRLIFDELPSSIGELIHLRCLDIFHTFIKEAVVGIGGEIGVVKPVEGLRRSRRKGRKKRRRREGGTRELARWSMSAREERGSSPSLSEEVNQDRALEMD
ncbi:hypothetical protein MIMGU_mgv1a024970mg, partial [Erythranthe guttata]